MRSSRAPSWCLLALAGLLFGSFEIHAASHEHLRRAIQEAAGSHPAPASEHLEIAFEGPGPRCQACLNSLRTNAWCSELGAGETRALVVGEVIAFADAPSRSRPFRLPDVRGPPRS